jgi:hypothetical protein
MTARWTALWIAAAIPLAAPAALADPKQGGEAIGFDEGSSAPAADSPQTAPAPGTEAATDDDAFLTGQQTEEQQILAAPAVDEGATRAEDPKKKYFSLGPRLRWIMIPEWFIGMFGVDVQTNDSRHLLINNVGVGAEFTYRKDGMDITAAIWWAGLKWKDGVAFKEKGEEPNSWEVVENNLSTLLFSVDFVWSTSFTDWFALTYGAGLGIGIPIARDNEPFIRTESDVGEDPSGLTPCTEGDWSEDDANGCVIGEQNGETYKLPTGIVPWINFLLGLRFKPHRNVALYVDTGFGIGFQLGLRGGYIF